MYEAKNGFEKDLQFRFSRLRLNTFALVATLVLCGQLALAEEPHQQVFGSPEKLAPLYSPQRSKQIIVHCWKFWARQAKT